MGLLFTNWWHSPIVEDKAYITHWTWRSRDVYIEPLPLALRHRKVLCRLPKEKHNNKYRDPQPDKQHMRDLGPLSPNQFVSIKCLLSGLREQCRREGRKSVKRQRGLRILRKEGSLSQHDRYIYELIETEAACKRPPWGPRAERRHGHMHPSLTQTLSPIDNHL